MTHVALLPRRDPDPVTREGGGQIAQGDEGREADSGVWTI